MHKSSLTTSKFHTESSGKIHGVNLFSLSSIARSSVAINKNSGEKINEQVATGANGVDLRVPALRYNGELRINLASLSIFRDS